MRLSVIADCCGSSPLYSPLHGPVSVCDQPHALLPKTVSGCYYSGLMKTQIILLNGVGSAGKSSIAKSLQEILTAPFLHIQMDTFFAMLPDELQNHPEGFYFEDQNPNGLPSIRISDGPFGARLMSGMRSAIAALAKAGNNLIVDDVILDSGWQEYRTLLAPFSSVTVGVYARLETLEQRERQRGASGRVL